MSDSTPNLPQMSSSQASKEVLFNQLIDALSPAALYGRNALTTTGLTWGYFGGRFSSLSISNGTLDLTASSTNYIVADRSNGAVSFETVASKWLNQTDYLRLYLVTAGASTITAYEDHRQALGNASGGGGGGGVSSLNGEVGAVDIVPGAGITVGVNSSGEIVISATGVVNATQVIPIACSDETTALTTGSAKVTFRMPYAFTLTGVRASLTTAQASGSIFTVDINESGSSILSTKITIDNTEKTSATAATPPVVSDASLSDDAEITIDIDQIGASGATGLKVYLIGYPT